jgi:hypothetical protein
MAFKLAYGQIEEGAMLPPGSTVGGAGEGTTAGERDDPGRRAKLRGGDLHVESAAGEGGAPRRCGRTRRSSATVPARCIAATGALVRQIQWRLGPACATMSSSTLAPPQPTTSPCSSSRTLLAAAAAVARPRGAAGASVGRPPGRRPPTWGGHWC